MAIEQMGWPEAATTIVVMIAFMFVMSVIVTGRWPWEKGGKG